MGRRDTEDVNIQVNDNQENGLNYKTDSAKFYALFTFYIIKFSGTMQSSIMLSR